MKMTRSNKNSTVLGAVRAVVIGAVCGAVYVRDFWLSLLLAL